MSPEDTLVYESRHRIRQTAIAVGAGVLLIAALILSHVGPHAPSPAGSEITTQLIYYHKRGILLILAAVITAIGEIGVGATLIYLYRCASARNDRAMPFVPVVVALGVVAAVIGGVVDAIVIAGRANTFVTTGAQTYDQANHLTKGAVITIMPILLELGLLLTAISFVLVSLQANRVGLLPRFLGYIGMFAGVVVLFANGLAPVVEMYWLASVAILFSGNWPSGLPAAWRTGKAEPWPPAAELRARRMAEAQETRERKQSRRDRVRDASPAKAPQPTGADADTSAAAADDAPDTPHAGTSARKRKRKRRH